MKLDNTLPVASRLKPIAFNDLPSFAEEGLLDAWAAFRRTRAVVSCEAEALRPALPSPPGWRSFFRELRDFDPRGDRDVAQLLREKFDLFTVADEESGFFTGYYEPEVEGALRRSAAFPEPLFGRPKDLETFPQGFFPLGTGLAAGRRGSHGALIPYPTRAAIEDGACRGSAEPLVWLRDGIEAFMIHVQGSARVKLRDGSKVRLTYAGRNGQAYTSIGAILIESGAIKADEMSLDRLKAWVRQNGQGAGDAGRALMRRNASYIFFRINESLATADGPIGAAGAPLTPLRSLAIDRELWPYGLPYWITGDWSSDGDNHSFQRLMIGQDTGSAIRGPARGDIFFGAGEDAGRLASKVRHKGRMIVFLPRL